MSTAAQVSTAPRDWPRALAGTGPEGEAAASRLHALLLAVARRELRRRRAQLPIAGPELDDIAHQATDDALVAIVAKLGEFRGESRFTTWAHRFVVFEVAAKVGRHQWRWRAQRAAEPDWELLADRSGPDPTRRSEWAELVAALRRAVDEELSDHQRRVFVALALEGSPPEELAAELGSTPNALYKALSDARRKLRASLAASGHLTRV